MYVLNRFQNLLSGLLATAILFVLLALIFDLIVMPIYTSSGQEIELPDVTEMLFEEAYQDLKSKGFSVTREPDKHDSVLKKGTVLYQDPAPFKIVKHGRRISLTVSAGIRMVDVPAVIGVSERDAIISLKKAGLNIGEIRYRINSYYPRGVVCKQSITDGVPDIPESTVVDLTVSIGKRPDRFLVPDVVLKSLDEARKAITKAGLHLGKIKYSINEDLIPETIMSQSIKSGMEITQGDRIDLEVSQLEALWKE